jgi:hypothetical protein
MLLGLKEVRVATMLPALLFAPVVAAPECRSAASAGAPACGPVPLSLTIVAGEMPGSGQHEP